MTARQGQGAGLEVSTAEIVASSPASREEVASGTAGRRRRWRWVAAVGVAVLGVGALVSAGLTLGRGGGDAVVAQPAKQPPAPGPVAPAALTMTVGLPATVVAGRLATIEVHYADGNGRFGGSTEDWGDGLGTSSLREGTCGAVPAAATPLSGSYRLTHTWARPGIYTVQLGVSSYACTGSGPVEEQASKKVAVTVAAR